MGDWIQFRALKEAVSLEAVLRYYQVPGLRRHRSQLEGCCPIHRGQRDDSFRASLTKNVFHCFACQAQGNVLDFVAAMENCSIREAACRLQRWFGVAASAIPAYSAGGAQKSELVREKEGCNPPLRFALTGVDHSHPYLQQRGVDRVTAAEFGVGFYGGPGLMSGRIVIPIRNTRGELVAYAGRAPDGKVPKYKLPAGFRKAWELFNIQRAAATSSKTAIVVEGYFDCLRVHQAGFPFAVALMGSALSTSQERLLTERFERAILMLDGDEAGRAASRVIGTRLSEKCSVVVIDVPEGAQPNQLPFGRHDPARTPLREPARRAERRSTSRPSCECFEIAIRRGGEPGVGAQRARRAKARKLPLRTVFILGAGASKQAGSRKTSTLLMRPSTRSRRYKYYVSARRFNRQAFRGRSRRHPATRSRRWRR